MAIKLSECYRILGVSPQMRWDEVKRSYHFLAKRYHPDIHPNNPALGIRFSKMTQAFKMLETHYKIRSGAQRNLAEKRSFKPRVKIEEPKADKPVMAEPLGKFPTQLPNSRHGGSLRSNGLETWFSKIGENLFDLEKKLFLLDLKKNIYIKEPLTARANLLRVKKGQESFQVKIPPGPWTRMFIRVPEKGEKSFFSSKRGDLLLNIHVPNREQVEPPNPIFYYKIKVPRKSVLAGKAFTLNSSQGPIHFKLPKTAEDGQDFIVKSSADAQGSPSASHILTVKLV